MTLSDLGERVGRAPSQLSLLENGKREPKLSLLTSLAKALGVSVEELLSASRPAAAPSWRSRWRRPSATPCTTR